MGNLKIKVQNIIILPVFSILCAGGLFAVSAAFVDAETAPKNDYVLFGSLGLIVLFIVFSFFQKIKITKLFQHFSLIISILCAAQAIYGILQFCGVFSAYNGFRVTGSFDNPAGFAACLCAGAPFCLGLTYSRSAINRAPTFCYVFTILCFAVIAFAVALSASRTGMVALTTVGIAAGLKYTKFEHSTFWKRVTVGVKIVIIALVLALVVALYFLKKDSADGRLFVWRCSLEMIQEKPVFGYGTNGFKANYMNFQAKFFEENPESRFVMLADNVGTSFNEYISLVTDYGLAGLLLFSLLVVFIWKSFKRNKNKTVFDFIAITCLLSIAVFAFFSYPLRYAFVWVVAALSVIFIVFRANYTLKLPKFAVYFLKITAILCAIILSIFSYRQMQAEKLWCKIAHKSLAGQTEKMLPFYEKLHKTLSHNELFLYNYAAELNVAGSYEESLKIAQECTGLWADYDLQMLIADNFLKIRQYKKSEQHYKRAAAMCPVKFMPLYQLFKLYKTTEQPQKAVQMAKLISEKPVKILSPTIKRIKAEVEQYTNFCP